MSARYITLKSIEVDPLNYKQDFILQIKSGKIKPQDAANYYASRGKSLKKWEEFCNEYNNFINPINS